MQRDDGHDRGYGYRTQRYGSNQRWVLKALREVPYSIARIVEGVRPADAARRTDADEWSMVEIVGYLRDAEREDVASVRAILRRDGAPIPERRAHFGPLEHDYTSDSAEDLLWEYFSMREDLVWMLRDREDAWDRAGRHPYRGPVTLDRLAHEINERDLEVMWRLQRVVDALDLPNASRQSRLRRRLV